MLDPPAEMITIRITHRCQCAQLPHLHDTRGSTHCGTCPNEAAYAWQWADASSVIMVCVEHAAARRRVYDGPLYGEYTIRSLG